MIYVLVSSEMGNPHALGLYPRKKKIEVKEFQKKTFIALKLKKV